MKIIYQFFDLNGNIEIMAVVSTVGLFLSFAGLFIWAFMLSNKHTKEMSQLPLDNETY
jgi:hypothetical protein